MYAIKYIRPSRSMKLNVTVIILISVSRKIIRSVL